MHKPHVKEQQVIELYQSGLSIGDIYKQLKMGKNTVHRILKRNNIERRSTGGQYKLSPDQQKQLVALYEQGVHMKCLCDKFNCAPITARTIVKRMGGSIARKGCQKHVWTEEDIQNIVTAYGDGKSQTAIANLYGVSQTTISTILIKNGITNR